MTDAPHCPCCPFCFATTSDYLEVVNDGRDKQPRWQVWHKYNGCRLSPRTWDWEWWVKRTQPVMPPTKFEQRKAERDKELGIT